MTIPTDLSPFLAAATDLVSGIEPTAIRGRITQVVGTIAEGSGPPLPLGARVLAGEGDRKWELEVIGFRGRTMLLMPYDFTEGLTPGLPFESIPAHREIPYGPGLLGRVIDALGNPLDGKGPLTEVVKRPRTLTSLNPVSRARIESPLPTGVRAIDSCLTIGKGQKIGIFSGSGVGKSVLLGMVARNTAADVNVIALIGERGKEVLEFIQNDLGEAGLGRSVLVVVTSDESPLKRLKAAQLATAIAAQFRNDGKQVMLMMDSLTRVAHAQRELGLAVGEPPTSRGYPPSVFAVIPQLLEQAGPTQEGAVTGIYTVLVEGDDFNEPVADLARSILEGHIVLSRTLASAGHYPAIDLLESLSRCFTQIATEDQRSHAGEVRSLLAQYNEVKDLVQIGAYRPGTNAETDRMLARLPQIHAFLRQTISEGSGYNTTLAKLKEVAQPPLPTAPLPPPQMPIRPQGGIARG